MAELHEKRLPVAMWLVVVVVLANALAYAHAVANPLPWDDSWTFIDTFLRESAEDGLDAGDFLVKRAGVDHGQPLNKLVLLLNARWFALDFSLEALLGIALAGLAFLLIRYIAGSDMPRQERGAAFHVAMAAIAAVMLSLNNASAFTFSLVSMGFLLMLLAVATFHLAWRSLQGGRRRDYAAVVLLYAIAGDTSGVLGGAAVAAALAWAGWRLRRQRRAWELIGITALALLVSQLVYAQFGPIRGTTQAIFNVPAGEHVAGLLAQAGDAWRWIVVPLVSGIAVESRLQAWFPGTWHAIQVLLGLLLVGAHLWFWHCALRATPRAAQFLAVCLMLLFYADVAGVVWGRVFVRGSAFLGQERYVLFYQLHVVALLLMAATCARRRRQPGSTPHRAVLVCAGALLLLQVPVAVGAWGRVEAINARYLDIAVDYGALARAPGALPPCERWRNFCRMSTRERIRTVEFLRDRQLNLFSPRFAAHHPELARAAGVPGN